MHRPIPDSPAHTTLARLWDKLNAARKRGEKLLDIASYSCRTSGITVSVSGRNAKHVLFIDAAGRCRRVTRQPWAAPAVASRHNLPIHTVGTND